MKFSNSAVVAVLASSVAVQAAPAPIVERQTDTQIIAKRDDLQRALEQYAELQALKVKRADLAAELAEREYQIVTDVLTAIKDTELVPVVLKFFVSNETLRNLTISGLEFVIRSGLISLQSLLDLAVQSGLVVSVVNDVITNCSVYVSIFDLITSIVGNILQGLFNKREEKRPYTLDEGIAMLRRDGLMPAPMVMETSEKRDVNDVVVELLESLASSGLALQVVETVLTDPEFISFGAQLVLQLNQDGLIDISAILSAVAQSGLLPQLINEFLNFDTIKDIGATAIDALDGTCLGTTTSSLSGNLTAGMTSTGSTAPADSGDSGDSLFNSLLGGITGLVGSFLGSGLGLGSDSGLANTVAAEPTLTTTVTTKSLLATVVNVAVDPCATAVVKRERLRMY